MIWFLIYDTIIDPQIVPTP